MCEFCSWVEEGGFVRGKGNPKGDVIHEYNNARNLRDDWRRFQYGAVIVWGWEEIWHMQYYRGMKHSMGF